MAISRTYRIFKQLGFEGLILSACVLVGMLLLFFDTSFPMKLLGIGVVILSTLGLIISIYQRGYVTGKVDIVEERRPSTPLPKNLKVDEIKTDKGKIKSFENVEAEISMELDTNKQKSKGVKKKTNLVQTFINFVAKDEEKLLIPHDKKNKSQIVELSATETPEQLDYTEGSFKILRKSKKATKEKPSKVEEEPRQGAQTKEVLSQSVPEEINQDEELKEEKPVEYKSKQSELEVKILYQEEQRGVREVEIPQYSNRKVDIQLSDLLAEENVVKGEPIKEMKLLFEKLLNVVGTVTRTITSAFYLVNGSKNELVLQAIVSHKPEALKKQRKIPLDGDLISQIVHRGKPEIIDFNTSTAELDLLPYYEKPAGARTFIGVPLILRGSIIGVLCADSNTPEAFDSYTMNFFLHYARVFSFFMESYTEKYELLLESQILSLVDEMRKGYFAGAAKFTDSMKHIFQTILNIFDFETFGLCLYDFDSKFYRVFIVKSKNNIDLALKNKRVDLKNTLLGKALLEKRTLNVEFDEKRIRAHYLESKLKYGTFVAVPVKTIVGVYGALFGWTDEPNPAIGQAIKSLEVVAFALGLFYENENLNYFSRSSANRSESKAEDTFYKKIEEEWKRANEFGVPFSVCKIAIDNYLIDNNLLGEFERASKNLVINNLKKHLKDFDTMYELDNNSIGAILVGKTAKEAKFLFEVIRKTIAQTMIKINDENVFFTISVGITQFYRDTDVDKLIENVNKALEISCSRKNTITLF